MISVTKRSEKCLKEILCSLHYDQHLAFEIYCLLLKHSNTVYDDYGLFQHFGAFSKAKKLIYRAKHTSVYCTKCFISLDFAFFFLPLTCNLEVFSSSVSYNDGKYSFGRQTGITCGQKGSCWRSDYFSDVHHINVVWKKRLFHVTAAMR